MVLQWALLSVLGLAFIGLLFLCSLWVLSRLRVASLTFQYSFSCSSFVHSVLWASGCWFCILAAVLSVCTIGFLVCFMCIGCFWSLVWTRFAGILTLIGPLLFCGLGFIRSTEVAKYCMVGWSAPTVQNPQELKKTIMQNHHQITMPVPTPLQHEAY